MTIPTNDLIYCAAVLDAKAHIARHRIARTGEQRPELVVTTRYRVVAEKLRATFGVGSIHARPNQKTSWNWKVYGENVHQVLALALPYLVAQRERALLLIEFPNYTAKGKRP